MNILVVIYNSLIRLPIMKHLTGSGNNIIAATDGNSALDTLKEGIADCVILDPNLPAIINGIDLLKNIKKNYPMVKIIIINSNLDETIIKALIKIGIKHIINTPVNLENLSNVISSI